MIKDIRIYITTNRSMFPAQLKDGVVAFIHVRRRMTSDGYHYCANVVASGVSSYIATSGSGYVSGEEEVFDHEIFLDAIMLKDFGDDEVTSILGGIISKDDILRVAHENGIELTAADIDCIMSDMDLDCDHYGSMREYISGVIDEYLRQ